MQSLQLNRVLGVLKTSTVLFCAAFTTQAVADDDSRQIEEVIVTAQRASESIQDVPIAVTALSGDMLEDRQILWSI
jgi:iron complex outermembrane receptor protein